METYCARYVTFKDFPDASRAYPTQLAKAGFYYVGQDDTVRCFSCSVSRSNWEFYENPLEIHKSMSPNCSFLQQGLNSISGLDTIVSNITNGCPESSHLYADLNTTHDWNILSPRPNVTECEINILKEDGACKFEKFKTFSNRQQSFQSWKYGCIQDPHRLAESGFFYEGRDDSVCCYSCGGVLREWEKDDDPWIEHARLYPICAHVALNKGSSFIQHAQPRSNESSSNTNDFDRDLGNNEIIRSLLANGFNRSEVTEAVMIWKNRTDRPFTSDDLQEIILSLERSCRKLRTSCHKEDSNQRAVAQEEKSLSYYNMSLWCDSLKKEKQELEKTVGCKQLEIKQCQDSMKDITEDLHRLKTQLSCKICLTDNVRVVLLPCGHMFCEICSARVQKCGICRAEIKDRVKVYMS